MENYMGKEMNQKNETDAADKHREYMTDYKGCFYNEEEQLEDIKLINSVLNNEELSEEDRWIRSLNLHSLLCKQQVRYELPTERHYKTTARRHDSYLLNKYGGVPISKVDKGVKVNHKVVKKDDQPDEDDLQNYYNSTNGNNNVIGGSGGGAYSVSTGTGTSIITVGSHIGSAGGTNYLQSNGVKVMIDGLDTDLIGSIDMPKTTSGIGAIQQKSKMMMYETSTLDSEKALRDWIKIGDKRDIEIETYDVYGQVIKTTTLKDAVIESYQPNTCGFNKLGSLEIEIFVNYTKFNVVIH